MTNIDIKADEQKLIDLLKETLKAKLGSEDYSKELRESFKVALESFKLLLLYKSAKTNGAYGILQNLNIDEGQIRRRLTTIMTEDLGLEISEANKLIEITEAEVKKESLTSRTQMGWCCRK